MPPPATYLLGAVQMTSTADRARNLDTAVRLLERGRRPGREARRACPRTSPSWGGTRSASPAPRRWRARRSAPPGGGAGARRSTSSPARSPRRWTSPARPPTPACSSPTTARIAAAYRKIHLFDVNIPDGARYAESRDGRRPGTRWCWPPRRSGASASPSATTCASRSSTAQLAGLGAEVVFIPAAFTLFTGKDHWEVLVRARAIENLAYVRGAGAGGAPLREPASPSATP